MIQETIDRLMKASAFLNERREFLVRELREHENHINSLHMGIEVGVRLHDNHVIGYGRLHKGWGLWYRPNHKLPFVESIFEAPLEAQLAMHLHMHYLVKALIKEAKFTTAELQRATTTVKEFLTAMGVNEEGKAGI